MIFERLNFFSTVLEHFCSILKSCLEEFHEIDSSTIELLLVPLLPNSKSVNPIVYNIIENTLKTITKHLEPGITKFIQQMLVSSSADETSELQDQIYPLIYELHKIAPNLLLKILPYLSLQLETDDEDQRLKALQLLGRLFASKLANYGVEFNKMFHCYLQRFSDVSVAIRLEMIETGALIMQRQEPLRLSIEGKMTKN